MDINQYIRQRRTIKPENYSDQVIENSTIEQLLENANWAPTHGYTEPWRFLVFTGDGLKKLGRFHAELYKRATPEEGFKEKTYDKLYERPVRSSHVIGIGMKRGDKPKIPQIEEIEATACAVQNMWLTASAYGLGAYWNSGGMTYHDEMKTFFGLDHPEDKVLGFLYLGYPAIDWPQGKRVSEIGTKTQWITTNK